MDKNIETAKKELAKPRKLLLPSYFRWIGLSIIFLAILYPVIYKLLDPESLKSSRELVKMIIMSLANLGLSLIAVSRLKIENEAIWNIRFRSLVFACILGITQVILEPLKDLLTGQPIEDSTSQGLVFMLLLVYLSMFYLQKKAMEKGQN